ncbi:MAG: RNA-guided pseudouridylation complex pseudouridine synthase subunit Cbf5 [Candidatus Thalassarchaeum sp.]
MEEPELWQLSEPATNADFGCRPYERTLDQLLKSGVILVEKPRGPTSHQLTAWARNLLGISKIGHGGTLDPFATGLLTLLLGKATRLTDIVLRGDKTYVGVLRFGRPVDESELQELLTRLEGVIYNVPPLESAVKIQVRTRTIRSIRVVEVDPASRIAAFEASCSAGTYVRTLAKDIGLLLGTSCELTELHRSQTGSFSQSMACTMQQLADAAFLYHEHGDGRALSRLISPVESLLGGLPSITIKDGAAAALSHGAPLARPGVISAQKGVLEGTMVHLKTVKDEAVSVAVMKVDSDSLSEMKSGEVAVAKSVLMEPGTYPQSWSKE